MHTLNLNLVRVRDSLKKKKTKNLQIVDNKPLAQKQDIF